MYLTDNIRVLFRGELALFASWEPNDGTHYTGVIYIRPFDADGWRHGTIVAEVAPGDYIQSKTWARFAGNRDCPGTWMDYDADGDVGGSYNAIVLALFANLMAIALCGGEGSEEIDYLKSRAAKLRLTEWS